MNQIEFFDIHNPCIGVCENGANGYCKGCFRSREERQHWNSLENNVKQKIAQVCVSRKRRSQAKRTAKQDEIIASPQTDMFAKHS